MAGRGLYELCECQGGGAGGVPAQQVGGRTAPRRACRCVRAATGCARRRVGAVGGPVGVGEAGRQARGRKPSLVGPQPGRADGLGWAAQPVRAGAPPGSGAGGHRAGLRQGGFADEAGDVAGEEQDVAQTGSLGAVGQAVPRRAFEMAACLAGIATFGVALAALPQGVGG